MTEAAMAPSAGTPDAQDIKRIKIVDGTEPMAVDDAAPARDTAAAAVATPSPGHATEPSMRSLMALYYKRLFPTQQMFKWLSYGHDSAHAAADSSLPGRRELCFTLDGDVFVRYQSYKTWTDLAADLSRRVPSKIDIGPVYTHDPRQRAKYAREFKPVSREVVIDIDLTDYDGLRTCGSGGHICARCWPFMAVAIQVLDAALREDFGFRHILWVYSGRRGVHCWVADEGARCLLDDARGGLVNYLSVIKGVEGGMTKLGTGLAKHPALERAERMLQAAWRTHILPQQRLLDEPETYTPLLRYIQDEELTSQLAARWAAGGQGEAAPRSGSGRRASAAAAGSGAADGESLSLRRWNELESAVTAKAARLGGVRGRVLERGLSDIVFAYSYPRLDIEVTKKMNHLLKAPFCVHPKTGKVCVPIDPSAAWNFDLDAVPTVQQLAEELTAAGSSTAQQQSGLDAWSSTSLAPHITQFTDSFLAPLVAASRATLNDQAKAAATGSRAAVPGGLAW